MSSCLAITSSLVVIASVSKNNDNHDVIFFAPVMIAILVAEEGVICRHRCPLTLTPSCKRWGRDPLSSKPQSNNDDNGNGNNNKDTVIASVSKNHNNHNVVFFAPVVAVVAAANNGGTHLRGCPLTLMPLSVSCLCIRRRRDGYPLLSKPWSYNDNNNNDNVDDNKDAVIASAS